MECQYYKITEWPPLPGWTYLKGQIPSDAEREARKNLVDCIKETDAIIEMLDYCFDEEKRAAMFKQLGIAQSKEMEASNILTEILNSK